MARHSLTGLGRGGVSPSPSEPQPATTNRRAPSTDSFFGINGANLVSAGGGSGGAGGASSQAWYAKYKNSSFSSQHSASSFGENFGSYAAFDGRISNIRGRQTDRIKDLIVTKILI